MGFRPKPLGGFQGPTSKRKEEREVRERDGEKEGKEERRW